MKIIDLATHTSGLTYGFMMRTAVDAAYRREKVNAFDTPGGLDGMMDQLSRIPLEFSPGTRWNYSVGMDVLGYIIQKAYGMPLGEVLRAKLFEPLGMKDTAFYCPKDKTDRFTSCYQPAPGGGLKLQDDGQKSTYANPPALEAGGGGLVSTAHDYMQLCKMLVNGGTCDGVQILSPKSVQLFSLNHLQGGKETSDTARRACSARRATPAPVSRSAPGSMSTSPRRACPARPASSSGAARRQPPSGWTRGSSWRWSS